MEVIVDMLSKILGFLRFMWADRAYRIDFAFFSGPQVNQIKANCNEITFLNTGTSTVMIANVYVLAPGAQFSTSGNKNEMDVTTYSFFFKGAGTQGLLVARKIYV